MALTIGCDPEVFIFDTSTNKYISAHGLFPGTKKFPFPIPHGAVQVDGNALEFNIDPASTEDEFVNNIASVMSVLGRMVKDVNPNFVIRLEPIAEFDPEDFDKLPMEAKILGCDPDFNPSNGHPIRGPNITNVPIRTGSGHIHIGYCHGNPFDKQGFMERMMVAEKITPHLLEKAKGWETESSNERRKYYGAKNACRPKPYGVELRALDNLWLKSEETIREVYRTTVEAFSSLGIQESQE